MDIERHDIYGEVGNDTERYPGRFSVIISCGTLVTTCLIKHPRYSFDTTTNTGNNSNKNDAGWLCLLPDINYVIVSSFK